MEKRNGDDGTMKVYYGRWKAEDEWQNMRGGRRNAEDGRWKTEGRRQKTKDDDE